MKCDKCKDTCEGCGVVLTIDVEHSSDAIVQIIPALGWSAVYDGNVRRPLAAWGLTAGGWVSALAVEDGVEGAVHEVGDCHHFDGFLGIEHDQQESYDDLKAATGDRKQLSVAIESLKDAMDEALDSLNSRS